MTALTNQLGEMTGNIEKFSLSATNINQVPMIWIELSGDGFSTKLILDRADYQQFAQQLINAGNAMFPPDPPAEEKEESLSFPLKTQKAEEAIQELNEENEKLQVEARAFIDEQTAKGKSLKEIVDMADEEEVTFGPNAGSDRVAELQKARDNIKKVEVVKDPITEDTRIITDIKVHICDNCDKPLVARVNHMGHKFCSSDCMSSFKYPPPKCDNIHCNKILFEDGDGAHEDGHGTFCSLDCLRSHKPPKDDIVEPG